MVLLPKKKLRKAYDWEQRLSLGNQDSLTVDTRYTVKKANKKQYTLEEISKISIGRSNYLNKEAKGDMKSKLIIDRNNGRVLSSTLYQAVSLDFPTNILNTHAHENEHEEEANTNETKTLTKLYFLKVEDVGLK